MKANTSFFTLVLLLATTLPGLRISAQPYNPNPPYGNSNSYPQNNQIGVPSQPNYPYSPGNQPGYPYSPSSPDYQDPNFPNSNNPYYPNQPNSFGERRYPIQPFQNVPSSYYHPSPYPGLDNPLNNPYYPYSFNRENERIRLTPTELEFIRSQRRDLLGDVRGNAYGDGDISLNAYESLYGKTVQQMQSENSEYRNGIQNGIQSYQFELSLIHLNCRLPARTLFEQGVKSFDDRKFKTALTMFNQAEGKYQCLRSRRMKIDHQERVRERDLFNYLGKIHETFGDKSQAIKYFKLQFKISHEFNDFESELEVLSKLGALYQSLQNYDTAISYYNQALSLARKFENFSEESNTLEHLGNSYAQLGYLTKATGYYQQQLTLLEKNMPSKTVDPLGNLALSYRLLSNYVQAIDYQKKQLQVAQSFSDSVAEIKAYSGLGITSTYLGDYAKALEMHQMAIALAQKINDPVLEGISLSHQGRTYDAMGDYGKSIESYQKHLAIVQQTKDRQQQGIVLGNLGRIYDALGKHKQALQYHYQSLVIAQKVTDLPNQITALNNLGRSNIYLGRYDQAAIYLQRAIQISRQIKDKWEEGRALNQLGLALYKSGKLLEAEQTLRRGMIIWEGIRDRLGDRENWKVSIFDTQLGTYNLLQRVLVAQEKFKEALEVAERGRARVFVESLAQRFEDSQLKQKVIQSPNWQQIQQIAISRKATIVEYSIIYDEFEPEEKQAWLESELYIWIIQPTGEVFFYQNDLKLLRQQGISFDSLTSVSRSAKVAVAQFQILDPILWTQALQENPGFLVAGLLGVSLLGFIIIRVSIRGARARSSYLLNNKKQLQTRHANPQRQTNISEKSIIYDKEKKRVLVVKSISLGLGLLLTIIAGSTYFIWVKQPQLLANLLATKLSVQRGLTLVFKGQQRGSTHLQTQLTDLHKLLIQPIASLLPTDPDAQVIFILQDYLYLVPFAALKDSTDRYLIEKHTISISPSIQTLNMTRQRQNELKTTSLQSFLQRKDILVVGNPVMPVLPTIDGVQPEPLEPLPSAEAEAKEIARMLNTQALIGEEAKKFAVVKQMPNARVIHLATHGLLDDQRGLNSAIVLTASNQDDGLLTAQEIQAMRLKAELVVLSACDTGRGKITGDGVIGLSRSLFFAGVPSIVVSLWAIPDAPTSELMIEFYRNLQITTKAKALRQAMLTTMKKHPDPRDWAAFTLIGEAD